MKKITLIVLALIGLQGANIAQTTLIAPPNTGGNSTLRAPNGTAAHAYMRSIFFINPIEMLPLNLATINSCSFQLLGGTGSIPVSGNFTLYLSNDTDQQYAMGSNFNTAFAQMTPVYAGPYVVPATVGATVVPITFTSSFNYTGGSMYVGYSFESAGPYATSSATYAMSHFFDSPYGNMFETWLGYAESGTSLPASTSVGTNFRPSIIWGVANTATTEVELVTIDIPGEVSTFMNQTQNFTAEVVNSNNTGAMTNVSVSVVGAGANPFTDVVVIPSLAAGASQTVTFANYNPVASGATDFTVAVLVNDQLPANNVKFWTQNVSCTNVGQHPHDVTFTSGYGFGGSGIWTSKHSIPVSSTLTGVSVAIGSSAGNTGKSMSAVLLDATGAILAQGSPVTIAPSTTVTFPFNSAQALSANTDYFIGVLQPSATPAYYPIAYASYTPFIARPYYTFPAAGGTPNLDLYYGYFGIEPMLDFDAMTISATSSKTFVCKGAPVTLSVTGAPGTTFTWSPGNQNTASITVTLTPPGSSTAGPVFYNVVGTHTSGCLTDNAVVTISVAVCTQTTVGLEEAGDFGAIRTFPNPAVNGVTTISGLNGENTIDVINILGKVVYSTTTVKESETIDLSAFAAGQYLVKVSNSSSKQSKVFKILTQ